MSSQSGEIDIQDLVLEVQAEFAEIIEELFNDVQTPQLRRLLQMRLASMPPEQKEAIYRRDPQSYESIERLANDTETY